MTYDIELSAESLFVEICLPKSDNLDEMIKALSEGPVRVTHLPTGLSAIGEGQGNQIKNKEHALDLLKARLKTEI